MAKKSPTIEEVKKAKIKLESEILNIVQAFESDYGVRISYIDMQRKYEGEDSPIPVSNAKPGKLKNVTANMELDLIY